MSLFAIHASTTLRARQDGGRLEDFVPRGPSNTYHVDAPPRSVPETKTWLKLQAIVSMNHPDGIPLKDLVKFVRDSTRDEAAGFPRGIPIYLDPLGLQDADIKADAMITIDVDGIRLEKALRLALRSVNLAINLDKDGLLTITSSGCDDGAPIPVEYANWQALDGLREDIQALKTEVSDLRQALRRDGRVPAANPPIVAAPAGKPGGGFN